MTSRVIQWTTGNVGKQSVAAVAAHPDLELVGCFAWSADKAGCVAGIAFSWHGKVNGRSVVELRFGWRKGQTLEPDWPIDTGHRIKVDGCPNIALRMDITPPPDFKGTTMNDFMRLPTILTAMPAINAIPKVIAAAPGIVTYADILPLPRELVSL